MKAQEREVKRYLQTGDHDEKYAVWSGDGFFARAKVGDAVLRNALTEKIKTRQSGIRLPESRVPPDLAAFTRTKVTPMVRGLFSRSEQDVILNLLERSVVFLTPDGGKGFWSDAHLPGALTRIIHEF